MRRNMLQINFPQLPRPLRLPSLCRAPHKRTIGNWKNRPESESNKKENVSFGTGKVKNAVMGFSEERAEAGEVDFSPFSRPFLERGKFRRSNLWRCFGVVNVTEIFRGLRWKAQSSFSQRLKEAFKLNLSSIWFASPIGLSFRSIVIWINSCVTLGSSSSPTWRSLSKCRAPHLPPRNRKLPKMNWNNFIYEYHGIPRPFHASSSGNMARGKNKNISADIKNLNSFAAVIVHHASWCAALLIYTPPLVVWIFMSTRIGKHFRLTSNALRLYPLPSLECFRVEGNARQVDSFSSVRASLSTGSPWQKPFSLPFFTW